MAQFKLFGKDLKEYDKINIDELLQQLSVDDIKILGEELIDPDDSMVPPSQRCRYHIDKTPTGPFNRRHLIEFLERQAREEKDWEELKPFKKETRGKIWTAKIEERSTFFGDDRNMETEWDDILFKSTEEELVDLAAVLGFHGMLNQVQYHEAFVEQKERVPGAGGFQGVAKHQQFKLVQDEGPNMTDVEESINQLQANDPKLKELNLNNIKTMSLERMRGIAEAIKTNTQLEKLHLANTRATEKFAYALADALLVNKTLKVLNLESNYIKGDGIVALLQAINQNQSVSELRVANQRPSILGCKVEMRLAELLEMNGNLINFGIFVDVPAARVRIQECLQRNRDRKRCQRVGIAVPVIIKRENIRGSGYEAPRPYDEHGVEIRTQRVEATPPRQQASPPTSEDEEESTSEEE